VFASQRDDEQVERRGRSQETQAATQTKRQELLLCELLDRPDEELLECTLVETVARREIERAKTVQFDGRHLRHVANHVGDEEAIRAKPLKADGQKLKRRRLRREGIW
jgi:hypothetical protein